MQSDCRKIAGPFNGCGFCLFYHGVSAFETENFESKYTLLWLASGFIMLILVVFPQLLQFFARLVGIADPMNALFSVVFFCIIMILMALTAIVSKQNNRNKDLVQSVALLEKRVRELEENTDKRSVP